MPGAKPTAHAATNRSGAPFHVPGVGAVDADATVLLGDRLAASPAVVELASFGSLVIEDAKEEPQFELPDPTPATDPTPEG